jgi:hypothetical protein
MKKQRCTVFLQRITQRERERERACELKFKFNCKYCQSQIAQGQSWVHQNVMLSYHSLPLNSWQGDYVDGGSALVAEVADQGTSTLVHVCTIKSTQNCNKEAERIYTNTQRKDKDKISCFLKSKNQKSK